MRRSTTEKPRAAQGGLTALEMVLAVVVLGIVGAAASFFFASGMRGYQHSRASSDLALKAQIALERMNLELRDITGLSGGNQVAVVPDVSLQYASTTLPSPRTIGYDSAARVIYLSRNPGVGQQTLLDGVTAFTLRVDVSRDMDGAGSPNEISAIEIGFTAGGKNFNLRVLPRRFLYP